MRIVFKDFFMRYKFIYGWCYFVYNTVSNYLLLEKALLIFKIHSSDIASLAML